MKAVSKCAIAVLLAAVAALAQNVSSSVRAIIVDPSGAAATGAECVLTNQATGAVANAKADDQGACTFNVVQAGTYSFSAAAKGFKTLQTKDIVVVAGETRTLGRLPLEIGAISETVMVSGEVSQIQLATAEKSGSINELQLKNIAVKGRDMFALLLTVPGIVDNFNQNRETSSPDSLRGTFINGGRENAKNYAVDGITDLDTGSNNTVHFEPNMDAISEVRVLTSNYQAEFGRNGGGVITVITKGGSQDFHVNAYDTYRHESLNANSWWNNKNKTVKPPYRYRITGYNAGGPIYIPKTFNTNKDKLFFFWSQEFIGQKVDYGIRLQTMPTELERGGDFSQSFNTAGQLITIKDPTTGQQFPGNKIPAPRFNALGLSMLKFFPTPNYVDPDPTKKYSYNYKSVYSGAYPKREDLIRLDYNITPTLQVYGRYVQDKDEQQAPYGLWVNGNLNYNPTPTTFGQPGKGLVAHATKVFSPTLVNEFIFGKSHNNLYFYPADPSLVDRAKVGNPAQWYPDSATGVSYIDKVNYMPNIQFGGQPANTVDSRFGNIPYENFNDIYSFVDNIAKTQGAHNIKAGVYVEHTRKYQVGGGNYRGAFNFSTNSNNPYDTGNSFANALIGNINTYSEATARVNGDWTFMNIEFYAQDNWRVAKNLTIDVGMRFYHMPPQTDANHTIAAFNPGLYSRANAPLLYVPTLDASGKRVAMDPRTGTLYPNPYIGLFIPGSGNIANGAAVGGVNGYPAGLYTTGGLYYGPRLGFAWDIFGNGKTALRGGFGMFQDRLQGNPTMNTNGNPPVAYSPTAYFGSLDTYANGGGLTGPSSINNLLGYNNPGTTMNWSLGIQQQIKNFAIDIGYVGSASYHLLAAKNINPIPMGARFNKTYEDPSQPGKPLSDPFMKPYFGWNDITTVTNGYNANYNALQLSATRRLSRGLAMGISYTHSKTLGVADGDTSTVSPYFAPRFRNYGRLGFDRADQFVANYVYDLPKLGSKLNHRAAKVIFDNWQLGGITSFISGNVFTPGLGWTTSQEVTGSTEGARVNVTGDCNGPKTAAAWFNTAAFSAPVIGAWGNPNVTMANFGNAGQNVCRGPGTNNWDISISKRFPLMKEGRYIQFRTETFNTFNHTQFSGVDSGTQFNPSTGLQTSPTFGTINNSRAGRRIALSLRVVF